MSHRWIDRRRVNFAGVPFQLLIAVLGGWLPREQADVLHGLRVRWQSRRVQVIGCTPYPDEAFVIRCLRQITGETGLLREGRILLGDRDPKWSSGVEQWLATGASASFGHRRVRRAATFAERFVRSVKEECLNRIDPLGERHLRTTLQEFAAHHHHERNHQGLANELIEPPAAHRPSGAVRRRQRVGGILSYYYRSAA